MVRGAFVVLESLPLTANGSWIGVHCRHPTRTHMRAGVRSPQGELDIALAGLQELLRVAAGGPAGNFELGGHSLLAVQVW